MYSEMSRPTTFLVGGELGDIGTYHSMVPQTFVSTKKIQKTPSDENCSLMFFFEQNATKNNNTRPNANSGHK